MEVPASAKAPFLRKSLRDVFIKLDFVFRKWNIQKKPHLKKSYYPGNPRGQKDGTICLLV
jgi:hypothetical protein